MPSIYEILHEVANNVIGQFNVPQQPPVGIGDPRTYHHNSGNIQDIIQNERMMSARLLQSQLNDVFATSHTIGNTISTFPVTQTINQNHTRIDWVHGIGTYRNTTPAWIGGNQNGVPWNFTDILITVINLFQAQPGLGGPGIQLPQNADAVRSIKEMLSLFCVELGRSPSSIITTAVFYEICLWNPEMLRYAADFYPMAKGDAVTNFREFYNGNAFKIWNGNAFTFPFPVVYQYDNTAGHNILDARRLLCLEETLVIDWYNTLAQNPLPEPVVNLALGYAGTQINAQQEAGLRAELQALGMRVYGFPLAGSEEVKDTNIDWADSFFGKYTLDALYYMLTLRINSLGLTGIKIMQGIYLDKDNNNLQSLISLIVTAFHTVKTFLIPVNLYNKHATGLIVEVNEYNVLQVKYLDPLNKPIPEELKKLFDSIPGHAISLKQLIVEQQQYANCGPMVIESFIEYLTGHRIGQKETLEAYSQLYVQQYLLEEAWKEKQAKEAVQTKSDQVTKVVYSSKKTVTQPVNQVIEKQQLAGVEQEPTKFSLGQESIKDLALQQQAKVMQTRAEPWYYGAEKVIASMLGKILENFVDTLRMAMYVDPHEAPAVLHSIASTGACSVSHRPSMYNSELRDVLSQYKAANSRKSFNEKEKFSDPLQPLPDLLDGIELSGGDFESWLQQFKSEAPLLGE